MHDAYRQIDDDRDKIYAVIDSGGIVDGPGAYFEDFEDPVSDVLSFLAVRQDITPP